MSREMTAVYRLFSLFIIAFMIIGGDAKPPMRIVGGTDSPLGEMIFQASLKYNGKHRCGGTLVSTKHILTAAHCVHNIDSPFNNIVAVTGTNSLSVGGEQHTIKNIDIHPNFTAHKDGFWNNDIAIITLHRDINVNTLQAPISLPDEDAPNRAVGIVSGWGYKEFEDFPDGEFSDILQKSDMTILNNIECQKSHKTIIDDTLICGYKGVFVGTCKGDGGSPLIYDGYLVGISSWFWPCGLGLPDVYTRVYHYLPWILEVMSRAYYEEFANFDDFANFEK